MEEQKAKVIAVVTYAVLAMMFMLLAAVLLKMLFQPNSSDQNLLIMVSQAIIGIVTGVIGYYFGSSEGSRKKDVLLTKGETSEKTD